MQQLNQGRFNKSSRPSFSSEYNHTHTHTHTPEPEPEPEPDSDTHCLPAGPAGMDAAYKKVNGNCSPQEDTEGQEGSGVNTV